MGRGSAMGEERRPTDEQDILAWAKKWQPKWSPQITFPQNPFLVGLFDYANRTSDLDVTFVDSLHRLPFRLEHAYDPDELEHTVELRELDASLTVVPFKPAYGRSFTHALRKRRFFSLAKQLERHAHGLIERMPIESRGHQIRALQDVMELLQFSPEVVDMTRETLFGNPDPAKFQYLSNPVSFINLQNGWIVVPRKDAKLKLNLGVEYQHVFRLSYRFDSKEGPVVEDYQKYQTALANLSKQTVRRVFSNLGEYPSIIHSPFFSDISQRFPVRFVALNNGLLVATPGEGSTWEQGSFEFYQPTERREELFEALQT
jgi:hypothetical protein